MMYSDRKASDGNSFYEGDRPCLQLNLPSLSLSLSTMHCAAERTFRCSAAHPFAVYSVVLRMVRQDVFVPTARKVAIAAPRLPVAWSVPWQQGHAHLEVNSAMLKRGLAVYSRENCLLFLQNISNQFMNL